MVMPKIIIIIIIIMFLIELLSIVDIFHRLTLIGL